MWARIDRITLRVKSINSINEGDPKYLWVDITGINPQPQPQWLYSAGSGTFSDVLLPDTVESKAIQLAKQAKPGLINPATQAEALEGIRKGIAAILLLLLKLTEIPE